jgi:hypothetical protein
VKIDRLTKAMSWAVLVGSMSLWADLISGAHIYQFCDRIINGNPSGYGMFIIVWLIGLVVATVIGIGATYKIYASHDVDRHDSN